MISHLARKQIIVLAHQFRLGHAVQSAQQLPDAMQSVLDVLPHFSLEVQSKIAVLVANILQSQQAQDWLGLADYLEYELIEVLNAN